MKRVEERLRDLPETAKALGLEADEQLKRKIMRAAQEKKKPRGNVWLYRVAPLAAALVILVGAAVYFTRQPGAPLGPQATDTPLIQSFAAGSMPTGQKLAMDVPKGSITIQSNPNPSFRSIWAKASGGNFPLIGVDGRYYRLLTNPTSISSSLLGSELGAVDTYTSEPALAGKSGIVSNTVNQGETVYAVSGMRGAMVAANVNGQMRVFQRVSFGNSALVGGESLGDTLRADQAVALELTGVGTVRDAAVAQRLIGILLNNAFLQGSSAGESNKSLLIQLQSGIVLQLAVKGDQLMACGTWACPEFFGAFQEALQ